MLNKTYHFSKFYSPDDKISTPILGEADSVESVMDILNDDTDDKDKGDKEEKEIEVEEKDDKDKEDVELKDAEEEEEKDKLELKEKEDLTLDAPPRKKDILAKYPKFFQEFPFMEKMLFRDKAYTELFGSFDDAKEIAEKAENFGRLETEILNGRTDSLLKNVRETDTKAFYKIVDDYLPALARVDQQAYLNVVGNTIKYTIMEMVAEAKRKGDDGDPLREAALLLNQFVFMKSEFEPPRALSGKTESSREAEEERSSWLQEKYEDSLSELQTKTDNILKNTISEYIDQKGVMSGFVKKNAVREALDDVKESIRTDKTFIRQIDRLWEQASREKYSKTSLDKIRSAYLGKAKMLLPSAIKKARAEALKDLAPSARRKEDEEPEEKYVSREKRAPRSGKEEMQKGETVSDYFMRD